MVAGPAGHPDIAQQPVSAGQLAVRPCRSVGGSQKSGCRWHPPCRSSSARGGSLSVCWRLVCARPAGRGILFKSLRRGGWGLSCPGFFGAGVGGCPARFLPRRGLVALLWSLRLVCRPPAGFRLSQRRGWSVPLGWLCCAPARGAQQQPVCAVLGFSPAGGVCVVCRARHRPRCRLRLWARLCPRAVANKDDLLGIQNPLRAS